MTNMPSEITCSVVVPVYNEAATLGALHQELSRTLCEVGETYEIIYINDDSCDGTRDVLRSIFEKDPHVKVIHMTRRFGHQVSLLAGYDYARGQCVIVLDADLQHPPEVIPQLFGEWRLGSRVVYTIRRSTEAQSRLRAFMSSGFYWIVRKLSGLDIESGTADFYLLDRAVVEHIRGMREVHRFHRGLIPWLGYKRRAISYVARPRLAGQSKYSLRPILRFALDGIFSFSSVPLRVSIYVGCLIATFSMLYGVWVAIAWLSSEKTPPGWATLVVFITFLGGLQLFFMGLIGEYVGRIYEEVKGRPLYVTDCVWGDEGRA